MNPKNNFLERVVYNTEDFTLYLNKAGCHTCIISPREDPEIIDHFDMIVVPGGPDINPAIYGQMAHPETQFEKDGVRDHFEKKIIERAIEKEKPIFAICRGMQSVNAVLGGTLYQHLPDILDEVDHRSFAGPTAYTHTVKTADWMKDTLGEEIIINSWHHQGIDVLSPKLKPLAWSNDGLIEAFEAKKYMSPILGIQWHPEFLRDKKSIKLLEYFIEKSLLSKKNGVNN